MIPFFDEWTNEMTRLQSPEAKDIQQLHIGQIDGQTLCRYKGNVCNNLQTFFDDLSLSESSIGGQI